MRFGSELLRKAEQIFTIIHQVPPELMRFSFSVRCLGQSRVRSPLDVGSSHCQKEKERRRKAATLLGSSKDKYPLD